MHQISLCFALVPHYGERLTLNMTQCLVTAVNNTIFPLSGNPFEGNMDQEGPYIHPIRSYSPFSLLFCSHDCAYFALGAFPVQHTIDVIILYKRKEI